MRPHNLIVACLLVAVVGGSGCSRLTFIKPNLKHHDYEQVAPEYHLRNDSAQDAQRVVAIDQVALAAQSLQANQMDAAATHAAQAIKADPNSGDGYTILAMVEERRGQTAQAGTHYAKAVALSPQSGTALNNYGSWLCGHGRYAESLPLFDRALADPSYSTPAAALANAGSCALSAGQDDLAQRTLARALELDPANPVALEGMAAARFRAGQYMEARAFCERRLAVAPASVKLLQLASQIEQKLGDTAAAARYVQRMGTEFPQQRSESSGEANRK
jgi:type IV pilus assembly protein PilF